MSLIHWIEEEADGEPIEAVVIGEMGWGTFHSEHVPDYDIQPKGVVLSWDEAKLWLDYDFNSGFGAPDCNAIFAWTPSRVMAISQYDGATGIFSIPRNPVPCKPFMPGG